MAEQRIKDLNVKLTKTNRYKKNVGAALAGVERQVKN